MALSTPILFSVFNRPQQTERVFAAIREQQPRRLLIVQDGPRLGRRDDAFNIARVRELVTQVDWECQLETNFADGNLGCKRRMASGITWGFQRAERLIILEDDCLPAPSFFSFCEALLERYASDAKVLMISGDQFQPRRPTPPPYYFSKYAHIWGWASWRRAWSHFDLEIRGWPAFRDSKRFAEVCPDAAERAYWRDQLDRQHAGEIDSWDFPWMLAGWLHGAWTALPAVNLVSNLGFGAGATHTTCDASPLANLPTGELREEELCSWRPPSPARPDAEADRWTWRNVFQPAVGTATSTAAPLHPHARAWWRRWFSRTAVSS